MAGLFSRVKTWLKLETIKAADLNAEFDNVITNFIPTKIDDYSSSVSQMRTETSPGDQGSESQATSLAGEIERLRYAIRRMVGGSYWYDNPGISLNSVADTLNYSGSLPSNRIDSSRLDSYGFPSFLDAPSSGLTLTLKCSDTPFRCFIKNTIYEEDADLQISLTSPASYTLAINDASLTAQDSSKHQGEYDTSIIVNSSSGTPPTAGTYQAWKITHGGNTEYFLARYVSTTLLDKAKRGWFFDKDGLWIPRIAIANAYPITLCRLAYIFYVNTDGVGSLDVTYNSPYVSYDTPTGASVGDYWFDLENDTWKKFNGSSFEDNNSIFIGVAVVDGSNVIAVRSEDLGKVYSNENTVMLEKVDSNTISSSTKSNKISVYGKGIVSSFLGFIWSMSSDLDSGESDSSDVIYYLYVTNEGDTVISSVIPHDRNGSLYGYYHPSRPWRCVGYVKNDSSSNFLTPNEYSFIAKKINKESYSDTAAVNTTTTETSTAISTSIVTNGRPVLLVLGPQLNLSSVSYMQLSAAVGNATFNTVLRIKRNGVTICTTRYGFDNPNTANNMIVKYPLNICAIDNPPHGKNDYTVTIQNDDAVGSVTFSAGTLTAMEL